MKRILSWDFRSGPDVATVVEAVNDFAGASIYATAPDTGTDDYVVVLCTTPLTAEDAHKAWWDEWMAS